MARDRLPRDDDDSDDDRPRRAPRRQPRDGDDDNDFEETPRPRAKPAGGNTAVKVLAILGGVLVVITLICGGLIFMVYRSVARGFNDVQQQMQQDMQKNAARRGEEQKQQEAAAANSDKVKATAAAEAFIQEVKGGRAGAAYRMMSADYRRRTTEAEFAKLVAANSAGKGSTSPVRADLFAPDSGTTYTFEVWAGFKTVKLTAIKENGAWAIDVYTVTDR